MSRVRGKVAPLCRAPRASLADPPPALPQSKIPAIPSTLLASLSLPHHRARREHSSPSPLEPAQRPTHPASRVQPLNFFFPPDRKKRLHPELLSAKPKGNLSNTGVIPSLETPRPPRRREG